jgi:hypothetical protein
MTPINWSDLAFKDIEFSYDKLKNHSIFPVYTNTLDTQYQAAISQAKTATCEKDYQKALQTLICSQNVDFLFFSLKDNTDIYPNSIGQQSFQKIELKFENSTAYLKLPHFLQKNKEEWEGVKSKLDEIKSKEHIVFDLTQYTTGGTITAMELFESLFGKAFWDGLYQDTYKNRKFTWRVSKENAESVKGVDWSGYPAPLQVYFSKLVADLQSNVFQTITVTEPNWNSAAISFKMDENPLKGKKITIITCNEKGVAREILYPLMKLENVEHIQKGNPSPYYFSQKRTVQLPSGSSLSFPIKLVEF